jgi:methylphosphotriester-DNA--protein-cysteine methyltransferase
MKRGGLTRYFLKESYKRIRPVKRTRPHKKGWGSDWLSQPFDAVKRAPQLLQARALATQLQVEPSGLRQAVTLPRARDQRV